MLILQIVYPRVGQHFWGSPEMVANIFILQHGDQAKKGMYQRLSTCWHSLSPASVFFGFSKVKLQYSVSCFVNTWKTGEMCNNVLFIINCFIVVYWEI